MMFSWVGDDRTGSLKAGCFAQGGCSYAGSRVNR
jgi:hypothetical protein